MKKILIICQAVDERSPTLGFFVEWLQAFARKAESVEVIAFKTGPANLPPNVRVHDVRAKGEDVISRLLNFWKLLNGLLPKTDGVFVHMSPEYAIAAWPLVAIHGKPMALWYAHRSVTLRLHAATILSDRILTISPGSFPLDSKKVQAMGHGIPVEQFVQASPRPGRGKLLSVGRITPIKHLEMIIRAVGVLRDRGIPVALDIVGEAASDGDRDYHQKLKSLVAVEKLEGSVRFVGPVTYRGLFDVYVDYDAHVNAAPTGALDKAPLEAMAAGLPSVIVNDTFRNVLGPDADKLIAEPTAEALAERLAEAMGDAELGRRLRNICQRDHSLDRLIAGIMKAL